MMGNKKIDIPIIKNGKDICRLIFTRFDDGLFDVKIDTRKNSFRVQAYSLFSFRPQEIYPDDLKDYREHSISYHHGAENKPIVVHIKSEMKQEGELQYRSLPLCHIQAPNINNDFPLPILKLEIPDNIVNSAEQYQRKKRHYPVDIANSNVVEVFMLNDASSVINNMNRYATISFVQQMMSIEYFCTNTIISGSQKMHTYIPNKPESRCTIIKNLNGMALLINYYPEPTLDKRRKSLYFTFVENEYAEDILLNTILVYPEANEKDSSIGAYVGGATIRDLSILTGRDRKEKISDAFGQMKNSDGSISGRLRYTAAQATVHMDPLTIEEKVVIVKKAIDSAERLYQLSVEKRKEKLQTQNLLYDRGKKFRQAIMSLQNKARQGYYSDKDNSNKEPVLQWLLGDSEFAEEQSYLMLSKYLHLADCRLGCCQINEKLHWWLLYDDNWNVDIFCDQLNYYISSEDSCRYEEVIVTAGVDPTYTTPNIPADTTRIKNNCTMIPLGYKRFPGSVRQEIFEQKDRLLEKVYYEIVQEIKKVKLFGQTYNSSKKIYPNDLCPCGSGKKFKNCCGKQNKL